MSDSVTQLIPQHPNYVPDEANIIAAVQLLEQFLPNAEEVSASVENEAYFFDPGLNWSGVRCPKCTSDVESWWQECMVTAASNNFSSLVFALPCCSVEMSLNDLDYVQPAGFARFCMEATNPDSGISPEQLGMLEDCLGTNLKLISLRI